MNWTKIWKSCGYQLMGFQTLHWRRFYRCPLCFISSKIVVFRFSWKWPAMRMTGRLSAQCRPLVTAFCRAESGQPPASSGANLRPRQETRLTAVMSQVRLKYFTKNILYFRMKWGIVKLQLNSQLHLQSNPTWSPLKVNPTPPRVELELYLIIGLYHHHHPPTTVLF